LIADATSARVLKALSDAGIFQQRGVLIGTHAFAVLGNVLGYRWERSGLKTQDIDIAEDPVLRVGFPEISTDVPQVLENLQMGFLPVPSFNPLSPSTSFKVRGQALRVDFLGTETRPNQKRPIEIPRWKTAAQPLRYLDYLLEDPIRAVLVNGGGILVNVPSPARFALHKLIVSQERAVVFHAKKQKDLHQAFQVLSVLLSERPGDLRLAWSALKKRGKAWVKKAKDGLASSKKLLGQEGSGLQKILK
jgi:hypothetical protein